MTFLEQLQQSAGLLSENIANSSPFGNYTPMQASDFINTPFGQPIAQNRFEGNRFLMPDLSGSTYTPSNFSLAPGAGFNFGNMGTFTPGAFNQFYQAPMTSPAMARTTTSQMRGGGENRNRSPMTDNRSIGQIEQDLENARLRNTLLGLVNPAFGVLGLLGTLDDKQKVQDFKQRQFDMAKSIEDNQRASDAVSGFSGDTTVGDASTLGGTGGRRGGAGPNTGGPTGPGGTTSGPPGREGPGR